MTDTLLTLQEAATRARVSIYTMRALAKNGRLASVPLSRRSIRIRERDLAEFIEAHSVPARVSAYRQAGAAEAPA